MRHRGAARSLRILAVALLLLAMNKQLDLQVWFLEVVRHHARTHGWYAEHHRIQGLFLVALGVAGAAATAVLAGWSRGRWRQLALPILGVVLLGVYVLARAASHHGLDDWLGRLRVTPFLELGGIGLVVLGALFGVLRTPE